MYNNNGVKLTAENSKGVPEIFRNSAPDQLKIILTNESGEAITLTAGKDACGFDIYFPSSIPLIELEKMRIDEKGWSFGVDKAGECLKLTYIGSQGEKWEEQTEIVFTISNIATQAQPKTDMLQVNLLNFPLHIQSEVLTPLAISEPPKPGNASLKEILQVSLDNQGMIFVSQPNDKLSNTLFLNIKNRGKSSVYRGVGSKGAPTITITFVYGQGSGCLAPANRTSSNTSAWDIKAAVPYQEPENSWQVINPSKSSGKDYPEWILKPASDNKGVIGSDANANITFSFSHIISITPAGHTQAVIQFTGFWQDENTAYDDTVFVVDIAKVNVPATRGIVSFFSHKALIDTVNPKISTTITMKWALFNVSKLILLTSSPMINPREIDITDHSLITYGKIDIGLGMVSQNTSILITALAYDGSGAFLNSMQFTVLIRANFFKDPRDGTIYPAILINNQLWMTRNLGYKSASGSMVAGSQDKYGRLYQWDKAKAPENASGWRLPNREEWQNLINNYRDDKEAYKQLTAGGDSGFEALLNGVCKKSVPEKGSEYGYYWTSTDKGEKEAEYITVSSVSGSISAATKWDKEYFLSVRYVKDI